MNIKNQRKGKLFFFTISLLVIISIYLAKYTNLNLKKIDKDSESNTVTTFQYFQQLDSEK
nr:hypothetical protein [uncultured Romboutsia sp.]